MTVLDVVMHMLAVAFFACGVVSLASVVCWYLLRELSFRYRVLLAGRVKK